MTDNRRETMLGEAAKRGETIKKNLEGLGYGF